MVDTCILHPPPPPCDRDRYDHVILHLVQIEEARMEILRWVGVCNQGGFNLHISIFTLMSAQKSRVHQPHLTGRHPQSPPLRPPPPTAPTQPSAKSTPTSTRCQSARACSPATRWSGASCPRRRSSRRAWMQAPCGPPPPVERLMDRKEIDACPSSFDVRFRWSCNVCLLSQG